MFSFKSLIIFCAILAACYGDTQARKKHEYELYWHGFHYLLFLALKFKVIFVLGTIFTVGLVAGKIYGLLKFAEYVKKSHYYGDHHDDHPVYSNSHGPTYDGPTSGGFSSPGTLYSKSFSNGNGGSHYESLPPGFSSDQVPSNTQISAVGSISSPGQTYSSGIGQAYGPPSGHGRSIDMGENSVYENFHKFTNIIKKLNITETAFNDMNLMTDECRRKFVCQADFNANKSIVLKTAFDLLSDDSYSRYKTKQAITSLDECDRLYPNCLEAT